MTNLDRLLKQRHYFANKGPSSQGYGFSSGHVWMWELDYKQSWALKNWCFWTVVLEKTWESLGLQGDPTSPSYRRSVLGVHWKDWCQSSSILSTWYEEPAYWKRPWCWERLRAGGEGDDRGWDGWMASLTQWTWVWASSGRWWWTGKPGVLQSMGSQRVRHDWVTKQQYSTITKLWNIYLRWRNGLGQEDERPIKTAQSGDDKIRVQTQKQEWEESKEKWGGFTMKLTCLDGKLEGDEIAKDGS